MTKKLRVCLLAALAAAFSVGAVAEEAVISTASPKSIKEEIYPYTGIQVNQPDLTVGFSMKLSSTLLTPYRGGKIVSVRCAFGDGASNSPVKFFVRKGTANAENLTDADVRVKFGWNNVNLTPVEIPADNADDFYVGAVCHPPKGAYFLYGSMYGGLKADENYICFNAEQPLEQQEWFDKFDLDPNQPYPWLMFVTVEMPDGSLENILSIERSVHNNTGIAGSTGSQFLTVVNGGTNDITSLEITMTQGDKTWAQQLDLESAIEGGSTAPVNIMAPFNYLASGDVKVEITKVNDEPNNAGETERATMASLVAVPSDVARNFTKRPVLELVTSETQYRSATNYAECIEPLRNAYGSSITELIHHHVDQYSMNVDEMPLDDAYRLISAYSENLNDARYPCMWIDRCDQLNNALTLTGNYKATVCYDFITPTFLSVMYDEALAVPTFASLDLSPSYDANKRTVKLTVNGNITPGVLAQGEVPTLSVYLIEKSVPSTSQELPDSEWSDKNYPTDPATGLRTYIHPSVIRAMPTPIFGENITESGEFTRSYEMELESRSWNVENMRCIAFVQRPMTRNIRNRDIINSAEVSVIETSITNVNADAAKSVPEFYNVNGMRVDRSNLTPGFYIVRNGKTVKKIFVK